MTYTEEQIKGAIAKVLEIDFYSKELSEGRDAAIYNLKIHLGITDDDQETSE